MLAPQLLRLPCLGLVCFRVRTTPLLSAEETDKALQKKVSFQPPGHFAS